MDQKIAIEAANVELTRQNEYFRELFQKQQEAQAVASSTKQEPLSPLDSQEWATTAGKRSRLASNQFSDLSVNSCNTNTIDVISIQDQSAPCSNDLSYEELEIDFAQFRKRQRLDNDPFFGSTDDQQQEPSRRPSFRNERSLLSASANRRPEEDEISLDDMLLERANF